MRSLAAALFAASLSASLASQARAAGVTPGNETPVQRHQAEQRFFAGKSLLADKKYAEALVELRASLDIVASPNTRLLIARTLRDMGRLVEAYVEFERAMIEAKELAAADPRYAKAAQGAADDRAALEPEIGFVTVTVQNATAESKLKVANEEIRRAAWGQPAPVMPGTTDIVVETPGRAPVHKSVALKKGEKQAVTIDAGGSGDATAPVQPAATPEAQAPAPEQPKADRTSLRPYAYVAGGVAVIGLATFFIAGAMSNSTYDGLKTACPNGTCPPSKADDISSGKTQQTVANVGLALGLVGAAAGGVLFVLSMPSKTEQPRAGLVVGPGWVGARGSF